MNNLVMSVLTSVQVLECPTVGTFSLKQSTRGVLMLESKNRQKNLLHASLLCSLRTLQTTEGESKEKKKEKGTVIVGERTGR